MFLVLTLLLTQGACGNKGDLYLIDGENALQAGVGANEGIEKEIPGELQTPLEEDEDLRERRRRAMEELSDSPSAGEP